MKTALNLSLTIVMALAAVACLATFGAFALKTDHAGLRIFFAAFAAFGFVGNLAGALTCFNDMLKRAE
jgi:multidrug transporter EmrE-like cation transporter